MNTKAEAFIAIALAATVAAAQPAAADSVVRVHASDAADFERFLPALPAGVPWLVTDRRAPQKNTLLLPEAGSVSAWMLAPIPLERGAPFPVQSMRPAPSLAGM
jgi:hypothetical protein